MCLCLCLCLCLFVCLFVCLVYVVLLPVCLAACLQVNSGKEEEVAQARREAGNLRHELELKDEALQKETKRCEQQVSLARSHAHQVVQEVC